MCSDIGLKKLSHSADVGFGEFHFISTPVIPSSIHFFFLLKGPQGPLGMAGPLGEIGHKVIFNTLVFCFLVC